jgi:hypothetical protein
MANSSGRSPLRGSGLRPFGAEPTALSQAEPLVPNAEAIAYALRDDGPHYVLGAAFWCAFIDPMRTKWDQPYPCHFHAFLHNGLVKPHDGQGAKLTPLGGAVRDIMAKARASGMSAGTAETRSGSGLQPASPVGATSAETPKGGDL